jgi:ABC-type uncharacterized transport system permease subunit
MRWANWVKATPLLLIALGLAVCFRSNVWNIGAEGQFIIGAIFAGGVALLADKAQTGPLDRVLPSCWPGCWAAWPGRRITALLRDRFNANEILVSLMLVYVAEMVLSYLVYGPWKDPAGLQLPADHHLPGGDQIPRLMDGSRVNIGVLLALLGGGCVVGVPVPHPRRLCAAGGRAGAGGGALRRLLVAQALWTALLVSGGAAGLAGALEVAGPIGQLTPMCRWATALPPSSWPSSGGCTRWAWCSRRC